MKIIPFVPRSILAVALVRGQSIYSDVQRVAEATLECAREEFFDTAISIILNKFINEYEAAQNYTVPLPPVKQMREDTYKLIDTLEKLTVFDDVLTPTSVGAIISNQLHLDDQPSGGRQIFDDLQDYETAQSQLHWSDMAKYLFRIIFVDTLKPLYRQAEQSSANDHVSYILSNTLYKLYIARAISSNTTNHVIPPVSSVTDANLSIGVELLLDYIFDDGWATSVSQIKDKSLESDGTSEPGFSLRNILESIGGGKHESVAQQKTTLHRSPSEWLNILGTQNAFTVLQRLFEIDLNKTETVRNALWGKGVINGQYYYGFLPSMRAIALSNMLLSLPQNDTTSLPSGNYLILNKDSWSPSGLWQVSKASEWLDSIPRGTVNAEVLNSIDVLQNQLYTLFQAHLQRTRQTGSDSLHQAAVDQSEATDCFVSIDAFLKCEMQSLEPTYTRGRTLVGGGPCSSCFEDFAALMRCWACQILDTRSRETGVTTSSTVKTTSGTGSTSFTSTTAGDTCSVTDQVDNEVQPIIDQIPHYGPVSSDMTQKLNSALYDLALCDLKEISNSAPDELAGLKSVFVSSDLPDFLKWIAEYNSLTLPVQFKLIASYWRIKMLVLRDFIDQHSKFSEDDEGDSARTLSKRFVVDQGFQLGAAGTKSRAPEEEVLSQRETTETRASPGKTRYSRIAVADKLIDMARHQHGSTELTETQIFEVGAYWLAVQDNGVTENLLNRLNSTTLSQEEARRTLEEIKVAVEPLRSARQKLKSTLISEGIEPAVELLRSPDFEDKTDVQSKLRQLIVLVMEVQIEEAAMTRPSELQDFLLNLSTPEGTLEQIDLDKSLGLTVDLADISQRNWISMSGDLNATIRKYLPEQKVQQNRRLLVDIWGDATREADLTASINSDPPLATNPDDNSAYVIIYWYWQALMSDCTRSLESYEMPANIQTTLRDTEAARAQLSLDQTILCGKDRESLNMIIRKLLEPLLKLTELNKDLHKDPNFRDTLEKILRKCIEIVINSSGYHHQELADAMSEENIDAVLKWFVDYDTKLKILSRIDFGESFFSGAAEASSGSSTTDLDLKTTLEIHSEPTSRTSKLIQDFLELKGNHFFDKDDKEADLLSVNWYLEMYSSNCTVSIEDLVVPENSKANDSVVMTLREQLKSDLTALCSPRSGADSKNVLQDRILTPLYRLIEANSDNQTTDSSNLGNVSDATEAKKLASELSTLVNTAAVPQQTETKSKSGDRSGASLETDQNRLKLAWLFAIIDNSLVMSSSSLPVDIPDDRVTSRFKYTLQSRLKQTFLDYAVARRKMAELLIEKSVLPLLGSPLDNWNSAEGLAVELAYISQLTIYQLAAFGTEFSDIEAALTDGGSSDLEWLASIYPLLEEPLKQIPTQQALDPTHKAGMVTFIQTQRYGNPIESGLRPAPIEDAGTDDVFEFIAGTDAQDKSESAGVEAMTYSDWIEKYYALLIGKFHWDVLTGGSAAPMSQITLAVLQSVEHREQPHFSVELVEGSAAVDKLIDAVNTEMADAQKAAHDEGYDKSRTAQEVRDWLLSSTIARAFANGHPEMLKITAKRFHNRLLTMISTQPDAALSAIEGVKTCEDLLAWNNATVPNNECGAKDGGEREALWNLQIKPSLTHVKSLLEEGNQNKATSFSDHYVTSEQVLPLSAHVWSIIREGLLHYLKLDERDVQFVGSAGNQETFNLAAQSVTSFSTTKNYTIKWLADSAKNAVGHWLNTRVYSSLSSDRLEEIANIVVSAREKLQNPPDFSLTESIAGDVPRLLLDQAFVKHTCDNCEPYSHGRNVTGDTFLYSRVLSVAGLGAPVNAGTIIQEYRGFGWPQSTVQGSVYLDQVGEPWCLGISSLNWEWLNDYDADEQGPKSLYISDQQPAEAIMTSDPYLPLALISAFNLIATQDYKTLPIIIPKLEPVLNSDPDFPPESRNDHVGRKCRAAINFASRSSFRDAVSAVRDKLPYILIHVGQATYAGDPSAFWLDLFKDLGLYIRVMDKGSPGKDVWYDMEGAELAKAPVGDDPNQAINADVTRGPTANW